MYSMLRTIIIILWLLVPTITIQAQYNISWEDFVEEYTAEDEKIIDQDILEELSSLHSSPLNINQIDSVQLLCFPFLNEKQISSISKYIHNHTPILTLAELQFIHGLDYRTRRFLSLFLFCGPTLPKKRSSLSNQLFRGSHEITIRADIPLYQRDGYKNYSDEELIKNPNKKYLGNAIYNVIRYRYHYGDKVMYGMTLEKDSGEPFGTYGNYPYDSFTGYFIIQPRKTLYSMIIGDYRLHFGQGLIIGNQINNNLLDRRTYSSVSSIIKKHSSTDENNYFRGIAMTIRIGSVFITPFFSYRSIDATLKGDSTITTLKKDGYHRTILERSKKNNSQTWSGGMHLGLYIKRLTLGVSGVTTHYNRIIEPGKALYRYYALRGNVFYTSSFDYHYQGHQWSIEGEDAITENGAIALTNTIQFYSGKKFHIISLQRFYSYRYATPYSYAFKAGSGVQNEEGVYIGMDLNSFKKIMIRISGDIFYFPWITYNASNSSYGCKAFFQMTYLMNPNINLSVKYQYRLRENDSKIEYLNVLATSHSHKLHLQMNYTFSNKFRTVTSLDGIYNQNEKAHYGWMISERIHYTNKHLNTAMAMAYFNTDSYDERIYLYEPNLLYAMSFPTCYYHGISTSGTIGHSLFKNFNISLKYKFIHYFNRSTIGSGLQAIQSNTQQDLSFQLRYKF